jgi:hypothetical protein
VALDVRCVVVVPVREGLCWHNKNRHDRIEATLGALNECLETGTKVSCGMSDAQE